MNTVVLLTRAVFALPKTVPAIGTGLRPHEIRRLRVYEARPNPALKPPSAGRSPE